MGNLKDILYERIIYSIYWIGEGITYGYKTVELCKHLKQTQWMSRDQIKAYQVKKLRKLIEHVYNNVPYYRNIMLGKRITPDDIRSIEDIKHFPVLTKDIITANFQDIVFKGRNKRTTKQSRTSGTTGEPLTLLRDRNSRIWMHAALLRGWSWAQYNIGDTIFNLTTHGKMSTWGTIASRLMNSHYFSAMANKSQVIEYARKIKSLNPFCITGYASSLYLNANLYYQFNVMDNNIPVIFTCAEMLHGYQRDFIEKVFKGKVYDFYGSNEIGSIAYECEYNTKHISDEHVIVETLNSRGENLINTPGDIILTDLDNYAMPLIRYKIGDVGTLENDVCKCGRGLSVLKSIDGRSQEYLKTMDGHYIPGIYFPPLFRKFKGVEQFQIIQPDINCIILKIVKNQYYSRNDLDKMMNMIKEKIGNDVKIKVEQCDHIPLTSAGKTRLVISHLPTEF